jgi:hypothetical protein
MKMVVHSPTIMLIASNLDLFCDVKILQSLVCFVPTLESEYTNEICPTM